MNAVLRTVLQRLGLGVITLFVVSVVIFSSVTMLPGNFATAILGQSATPETVARVEGGVWRLYGTKWFTSATTSQMALTLARPEGAAPGGRALVQERLSSRPRSRSALAAAADPHMPHTAVLLRRTDRIDTHMAVSSP